MFYNWLKVEHTWVTDLIHDYAVPVSYVGLSTKDRRFIYPQKEVRHTGDRLLHIMTLLQELLSAHASAIVLRSSHDSLAGSSWYIGLHCNPMGKNPMCNIAERCNKLLIKEDVSLSNLHAAL